MLGLRDRESDRAPRIEKFRAVSEHFLVSNLAPDDYILKFTIGTTQKVR